MTGKKAETKHVRKQLSTELSQQALLRAVKDGVRR